MIDRMDNENLIFEVSKHKELYDTRNRNYFDPEIKNVIWNEIALKMNFTPEICKSRWRNLRTCFVNEIKKSERCSIGGKKTKKYIYYDKMLYLLPYLQHRKASSRENGQILDDNKINHDYEYEDSQSQLNSTDNEKREINFIDLRAEFIDQDNNDQDPISVEESHMEIENDRGESSDYQNNKVRVKEEKDDPMQMFFSTMYKTVKCFPPHLQIAAKKAIFNVVTNFEEKLVQDSSQFSNRNLANNSL